MPFILDRPSADQPTFIFWKVSLIDGVLKYPVKEKCHPKDWSNHRTASRSVNAMLTRIEHFYADIIEDLRSRNLPATKEAVREQLDLKLHRKRIVNDFWQAITSIIDDRESGVKLTRQGKRFSKETIKGYRHTLDNLRKFDPQLSFEKLTVQKYNEIISYFTSKDHSVNSIGKIIKNLRVFAAEAYDMGVHRNADFKRFKVPAEETNDVYLTMDEIEKIYAHNFPSKTLDLVRDWLVIDCLTGLRISDIKLLDIQNFESGMIRLANEKTDTQVVIPVHKYVKAIIKKYKGLPRKITDQRMNYHAKEVCQLAGINAPHLYSLTKGGKRVDHRVKKWEMVSNHTARRSFITNLLKMGVQIQEVMKLAGIKKLATIQKYYRESAEEVAQRVKSNKFFG